MIQSASAAISGVASTMMSRSGPDNPLSRITRRPSTPSDPPLDSHFWCSTRMSASSVAPSFPLRKISLTPSVAAGPW